MTAVKIEEGELTSHYQQADCAKNQRCIRAAADDTCQVYGCALTGCEYNPIAALAFHHPVRCGYAVQSSPLTFPSAPADPGTAKSMLRLISPSAK